MSGFDLTTVRTVFADLVHQPRWVCWRYEERKGKPTKVPLQPSGRKASVANPRDWSILARCAAYAEVTPGVGVGIVFNGDGLVGVDLDDCLDAATGEPNADAAAIVADLASYAERTPSGHGLHVLCRGALPGGATGTRRGEVEVYSTARFFTVTGAHLPGTPDEIVDATEALERLWASLGAHEPAAADGPGEGASEVYQAAPGPDTPWRRLNTAALVQLGAWVPELFGDAAKFVKGKGGYRISAADLGRDLEEDLSIMPHGIRDWGMGDLGPDRRDGGREGKRTPIDLVLEFGGAPDVLQAAAWLADRLGKAIEEFGFDSPPTKRRKKRGGGAEETGKAGTEDTRPKLFLVGGQRVEVLRGVEAALRDPARVKPGWIFARGLAPAVLRYSVDATKLRSGKVEITLPPRTAYLTAAKPEHMAALLDGLFSFARFKLNRDGDLVEVPCDCPLDLARHALANASLLPLLSISRTPVLRQDGSILDRPGYDLLTGIYYAPEIEFPPVPGNPTQEDARTALERLSRPFRDFPFATEADRAAVVGEVLTLLTRHLVPRAPAFLHNATEAGSGKTKLFDTISIVALGSNAALLNADILEDETELKKVLTTLTLAAAPLAVFDNVARGGEIRSPGLSNYLTATIYGDRLLGANEEVKAATCTMIGMTGNGCEIAGDNTRRILRIDLDAGVERPELREFAFDCEAEARDDRGELIAAALTVLRAHALAGWPRVGGRGALGSFEDWDRLVCGALAFAGAPDVLVLLEKTRTVDPERGRLVEVLRVLEGVGATRIGMKAGEIIRTVERVLKEREGDDEAKTEAQDWLEVLGRFGKGDKPSPAAIGKYLARNAGRVVDGMTLLAEIDTHAKTSTFRVKVERGKPRDATSGKPRHEERDLRGVAGVCGGKSHPFQSRGGAEGSCGRGNGSTARTPATPAKPPAMDGGSGVARAVRPRSIAAGQAVGRSGLGARGRWSGAGRRSPGPDPAPRVAEGNSERRAAPSGPRRRHHGDAVKRDLAHLPGVDAAERRCRLRKGGLDRRRPGRVPFADGPAAHVGCHEEADVARLLAAGERALAGAAATSGEGELVNEGEP